MHTAHVARQHDVCHGCATQVSRQGCPTCPKAVNYLPTDGGVLSVTVWTYYTGTARDSSVYSYKAASFPRILSPRDTAIIDSTETLIWSSVLNASEYVLGIGSGSRCEETDQYYSGQGLRTSATVNFTDPGGYKRACVRVWVRLGNVLVEGIGATYFLK